MSDDKRPDWKKGFDQVKLFYKDTKLTTLSSEFMKRAEAGKEIFVKNSKYTIQELRRVMPRMMINHQATLIGLKTYLKHKVYVYPTLKARLLLLSMVTCWMCFSTANLRHAMLYRMLGFYLMSNMLTPDLHIHQKRLSMELNEQLKWIVNFFK